MNIWLATILLALLQAPGSVQTPSTSADAALPPAYPRAGATVLFENDRVRVWDIAWLKQQYPLHRHIYALAGVYYTSGDRTIISTAGARRPVSTQAWSVVYQDSGVTHIEEGASDAPLKAVFFEFKETGARNKDDERSTPAAFPGDATPSLLDNPRTTIWEVKPGTGTTHLHVRDALVVTFTGLTPSVSYVKQGTAHAAEAERGDRVFVFELK